LLANPEKKQRIHLTSKEVALLKLLHQTSNRLVSRQTLLDAVWGYNASVTTHTLETHIYRLRQKMEADPTACRLLISMPGGYQLNAAG
jgi:DNA-binding response OmpR family regulator